MLPQLTLDSSQGPVAARFRGERLVLYIYPRAGRPGRPSPPGWDDIPGARGCTPESCAFRDHAGLAGRGALLAGSRRNARRASRVRRAKSASRIPVIAIPSHGSAGAALADVRRWRSTLYKRITLVVEACAIAKVFFRFSAGQERRRVVAWLGAGLKLVTFDDGKVGRVEGDVVTELAVGSMRAWYFETGRSRDATGEERRSPTCGCARRSSRRSSSTRPATSASTRTSRSTSTGRTRSRPGSSSSRTSTRSSGPTSRSSIPEHLTEELDYELELAVVIKKAGKWFSPEEAVDYIGGYVIFNDITARDIQRREMRSGVFSFCKAIDTFCPLGPWIVTPDEIPDPHDLRMELRVNGEPRQVSHSGNMSVTIPEILSHYSALGYSAGDVLSTGTVSASPASARTRRRCTSSRAT